MPGDISCGPNSFADPRDKINTEKPCPPPKYLDRELFCEEEHVWSPLVAVGLDHSPLVEEWPVVLVMLLRVVRMDGMGHVSRHEERVPDRHLQHFI